MMEPGVVTAHVLPKPPPPVPAVPSPLTGGYLLIIIGEPQCVDHKEIILKEVAKGLLSWKSQICSVDLEKELVIITEQGLEGEEARYGERLIQFASENLVTEILIHPLVNTLSQCVRNLLSSFTRHRQIIHAGYTFANNGSWILQDGTFSAADFLDACQDPEALRLVRAYENGVSIHIHCSDVGTSDWQRLAKEPALKQCQFVLNPNDVLTFGLPAITKFIEYLTPFLVPADLAKILQCSDVVGNIRFQRPTLYVFPGGQGDASLFGINGFIMLLDGGFSRKACFWDFIRHLDRLDAVLMTRLNNSNVGGLGAVLKRKRQNAIYPQIGHFFGNIQQADLSPDGDKDKDPLVISLFDEGQTIAGILKYFDLVPQMCFRDTEPINLYHKVGHGTLNMYVLNPAKDAKELRDFLHKWNSNDKRLFANPSKSLKDFMFPLQNLISICVLLIWRPSNPNDTVTRLLFPGSAEQTKIFEGLDRIKSVEALQKPVVRSRDLEPQISTIQTVLKKPQSYEKKKDDFDNRRLRQIIPTNQIDNEPVGDINLQLTKARVPKAPLKTVKKSGTVDLRAPPAKSTKEATNRNKVAKTADTTARKPISRRPKVPPPTSGSPVRKPLSKFDHRKKQLEKGAMTTNSSTISTPSVDQENPLIKKVSKMIKEEQEAVKEIEAVFKKSEQEPTLEPSEIRTVEPEEYLVIETTEVVKNIEESVIEEKHSKEETKEEVPELKVLKLTRSSAQIREVVKTPDEVADLPIDEVAVKEEELRIQPESEMKTVESPSMPHRMVVTASSEDGGEEIEICPAPEQITDEIGKGEEPVPDEEQGKEETEQGREQFICDTREVALKQDDRDEDTLKSSIMLKKDSLVIVSPIKTETPETVSVSSTTSDESTKKPQIKEDTSTLIKSDPMTTSIYAEEVPVAEEDKKEELPPKESSPIHKDIKSELEDSTVPEVPEKEFEEEETKLIDPMTTSICDDSTAEINDKIPEIPYESDKKSPAEHEVEPEDRKVKTKDEIDEQESNLVEKSDHIEDEPYQTKDDEKQDTKLIEEKELVELSPEQDEKIEDAKEIKDQTEIDHKPEENVKDIKVDTSEEIEKEKEDIPEKSPDTFKDEPPKLVEDTKMEIKPVLDQKEEKIEATNIEEDDQKILTDTKETDFKNDQITKICDITDETIGADENEEYEEQKDMGQEKDEVVPKEDDKSKIIKEDTVILSDQLIKEEEVHTSVETKVEDTKGTIRKTEEIEVDSGTDLTPDDEENILEEVREHPESKVVQDQQQDLHETSTIEYQSDYEPDLSPHEESVKSKLKEIDHEDSGEIEESQDLKKDQIILEEQRENKVEDHLDEKLRTIEDVKISIESPSIVHDEQNVTIEEIGEKKLREFEETSSETTIKTVLDKDTLKSHIIKEEIQSVSDKELSDSETEEISKVESIAIAPVKIDKAENTEKEEISKIDVVIDAKLKDTVIDEAIVSEIAHEKTVVKSDQIVPEIIEAEVKSSTQICEKVDSELKSEEFSIEETSDKGHFISEDVAVKKEEIQMEIEESELETEKVLKSEQVEEDFTPKIIEPTTAQLLDDENENITEICEKVTLEKVEVGITAEISTSNEPDSTEKTTEIEVEIKSKSEDEIILKADQIEEDYKETSKESIEDAEQICVKAEIKSDKIITEEISQLSTSDKKDFAVDDMVEKKEDLVIKKESKIDEVCDFQDTKEEEFQQVETDKLKDEVEEETKISSPQKAEETVESVDIKIESINIIEDEHTTQIQEDIKITEEFTDTTQQIDQSAKDDYSIQSEVEPTDSKIIEYEDKDKSTEIHEIIKVPSDPKIEESKMSPSEGSIKGDIEETVVDSESQQIDEPHIHDESEIESIIKDKIEVGKDLQTVESKIDADEKSSKLIEYSKSEVLTQISEEIKTVTTSKIDDNVALDDKIKEQGLESKIETEKDSKTDQFQLKDNNDVDKVIDENKGDELLTHQLHEEIIETKALTEDLTVLKIEETIKIEETTVIKSDQLQEEESKEFKSIKEGTEKSEDDHMEKIEIGKRSLEPEDKGDQDKIKIVEDSKVPLELEREVDKSPISKSDDEKIEKDSKEIHLIEEKTTSEVSKIEDVSKPDVELDSNLAELDKKDIASIECKQVEVKEVAIEKETKLQVETIESKSEVDLQIEEHQILKSDSSEKYDLNQQLPADHIEDKKVDKIIHKSPEIDDKEDINEAVSKKVEVSELLKEDDVKESKISNEELTIHEETVIKIEESVTVEIKASEVTETIESSEFKLEKSPEETSKLINESDKSNLDDERIKESTEKTSIDMLLENNQTPEVKQDIITTEVEESIVIIERKASKESEIIEDLPDVSEIKTEGKLLDSTLKEICKVKSDPQILEQFIAKSPEGLKGEQEISNADIKESFETGKSKSDPQIMEKTSEKSPIQSSSHSPASPEVKQDILKSPIEESVVPKPGTDAQKIEDLAESSESNIRKASIHTTIIEDSLEKDKLKLDDENVEKSNEKSPMQTPSNSPGSPEVKQDILKGPIEESVVPKPDTDAQIIEDLPESSEFKTVETSTHSTLIEDPLEKDKLKSDDQKIEESPGKRFSIEIPLAHPLSVELEQEALKNTVEEEETKIVQMSIEDSKVKDSSQTDEIKMKQSTSSIELDELQNVAVYSRKSVVDMPQSIVETTKTEVESKESISDPPKELDLDKEPLQQLPISSFKTVPAQDPMMMSFYGALPSDDEEKYESEDPVSEKGTSSDPNLIKPLTSSESKTRPRSSEDFEDTLSPVLQFSSSELTAEAIHEDHTVKIQRITLDSCQTTATERQIASDSCIESIITHEIPKSNVTRIEIDKSIVTQMTDVIASVSTVAQQRTSTALTMTDDDEKCHLYEMTQARYTTATTSSTEEDFYIAEDKDGGATVIHTRTETEEEIVDLDPVKSWGKPLGLPTIENTRSTPKKEPKRTAPNPLVGVKNRINDEKRRRSESPIKKRDTKKIHPVYVDLTYVPHHGNAYYTYVDFFKRVRARYYVFSGIEPGREVFNALLEAKQTWDDKNLEVTIIPTYDTDVLGYWIAENEDLLNKHKIDLSPSANRCTINLQDHETSCSAYRLEF